MPRGFEEEQRLEREAGGEECGRRGARPELCQPVKSQRGFDFFLTLSSRERHGLMMGVSRCLTAVV